jgi:hypothetical protein
MQQNLFREANSSSATQEILLILWNRKVHHRIHNSPPPVTILCKIDAVHVHRRTYQRSILLLSSHLRLGLPSGLFFRFFPLKPCMPFYASPYVLHAPPIRHYLVRKIVTRFTCHFLKSSQYLWLKSDVIYKRPVYVFTSHVHKLCKLHD